jgi:hypothetical protein
MKRGESLSLVVALCFIIMVTVIVAADPSWQVGFPNTIFNNLSEDVLFSYNFTQNVTNLENESLLFEIKNVSIGGVSVQYSSWLAIGSSSGNLTVNATNDTETGYFTVTVAVENASNYAGQASLFYFNITPVNDPPQFQGLTNKTFNMTQLFNYTFDITDEEANVPYNLNVTFLSCNVAQWSTRGTNCTLFSNYTVTYIQGNTTAEINIAFTPLRNDVGSYIIRFNATDSGNTTLPYNNSVSRDVNFTVNVINSQPYLRYLCDNERTATEDAPFTCLINASDIDEVNYLTFSTNYSWFTFNDSNPSIAIVTNITYEYNASANVSFLPGDLQVGSWNINLSVTDTGSPIGINSTIFSFHIANVPDFVFIDSISPVDAFTSNYYELNISAYDDDLLIPDKSEFNEVLSFNSNDSRVSVTSIQTLGNKTIARISFNGSSFTSGTYLINISVNDSGNAHTTSTLLTLNVSLNTAPSWISGIQTNFFLNENTSFVLNLSNNVTDPDSSDLNFTYTSFTFFPGFSLDADTGIISFTPQDSEVGFHNMIINVTDGIASTPQEFNFTVYNLNDTPDIETPLSVNVANASVDAYSNIITAEDNYVVITMNVRDDDLNITQKTFPFYNETLSVSLNISGPNTNLFNFTPSYIPNPPNGPGPVFSAVEIFQAVLLPRKADVGDYAVNLTVTDASGRNDSLQFNITIISVSHTPTLSQEENKTSTINNTLTFDLNGSDIEDGNDSTGNLTYNYSFLQGSSFLNSTNFNSSLGLFNVTFNNSQEGTYKINFTITDTDGMKSSIEMWVFVYGYPLILSPSVLNVFNMTENNITNITFTATHLVGDNLTYLLYINNSLRCSANGSGAGSTVNLSITPGFFDETHGGFVNLSLLVENPLYHELNASASWNANISHANAPIVFNGTINDKQSNYDHVITINLAQYFIDADHEDIFYNQSANFTVYSNATTNTTNSSIGYSFDNSSWILTLWASTNVTERLNISATDGQYSNVSNNFVVQFTPPTQTGGQEEQQAQQTGGGGGSQIEPVSLNIIVPGPLTARKQDRLIVPVAVENTGTIPLSGVLLRNTIAKNGLLRSDLLASFDKSFIPDLIPGQRENLTLIVDINTKDLGLYEITLNGTSTAPPYSDTAKLYVNVEEGDTVAQRLAFTEELIAQNPQCIELKEMITEAKTLLDKGQREESSALIERAVQACQNAIAQASKAKNRLQLYDRLINTSTIALIAAFVLGIIYYWYRKKSFESEFGKAQKQTSSADNSNIKPIG